MKTYFPSYCKKIGVALVFVAFILSFIANINDLYSGYVDGRTGISSYAERSYLEIIPIDLGERLAWISLAFSFGGFLLYLFSKEKVEDEFVQKLRFISLAKSLLYTWIVVSILLIIDGSVKLEGFYILQFQLILYMVIYNYLKKWKFK